MAKDDFLTGFLQGLYRGGVGNPEVQDRRSALDLERQKAVSSGQIQPSVPSDHPVWDKIRQTIFPGGIQGTMRAVPPTSVQVDPNAIPGATITGPMAQGGKVNLSTANAARILPYISPKKGTGTKSYLSDVSWDTATPQQKILAERMIRGEVRPIDLSFRDRGQVVALASERAKQLNVPFSSYSGDVKSGVAKYFAFGKGGQAATSLNTALGHLDDAMKSFDAINNTDVRLLNVPINKLKNYTDNGDIVGLELNLTALQNELATAFKGSGGTDQEINQWRTQLNSSLTPNQYMAMAHKIDDLLRSRLSSLEYQQGQGFQEPSKPKTLLSPRGKVISEKMGSNKGGGQVMFPNDPAKQKRYEQWKASQVK